MTTANNAETICCSSGAELGRLIAGSAATVVAIRRMAVPALFPSDLRAAVQTLPYDVACAVVTPAAAIGAGVGKPIVGETLVFARTALIARLPDAPDTGAHRLCAILTSGLSPYLQRPGSPSWDSDESDAYTISGRRLVASLAQVGDAWERRLLDHPSDRNGRA